MKFIKWVHVINLPHQDLTTKTCNGGLLYVNGTVLIGVVLKDAYNFLMDYSSLDKFVQHYNIYESSKFSLEEVILCQNFDWLLQFLPPFLTKFNCKASFGGDSKRQVFPGKIMR